MVVYKTGEIVHVVITVTNNSAAEATGVSVNIPLSELVGLTYDSYVADQGTFDGTDWSPGPVAASSEASINISLTIDDDSRESFGPMTCTVSSDDDGFSANDIVVKTIQGGVPCQDIKSCVGVFMVNSTSDINSIEGVNEGDLIGVRGFYSVGDAGQPWFYEVLDDEPIDFPEDDVITFATGNSKYAKLLRNGQMPVEWFGAKGDNVTDDTDALHKAMSYSTTLIFTSGKVYRISELFVEPNITLLGNRAELYQLSTVAPGKRMINIEQSNVTISNFILRGNISTDTGEHKHSINIYANTQSINNIRIEDCLAVNVRGDFVEIASSEESYIINDIKLINNRADNIYRNGISVINGSNIEINGFTATRTGLYTVDVEPYLKWHRVETIKIKNVLGHCVSVANNYGTPNTIIRNVEMSNVTLDQQYYGATEIITTKRTSAIQLRGLSGFKGNSLLIKNHDLFAIQFVKEVGDDYCENVVIDGFDISECYADGDGSQTLVQFGNKVKNFVLRNGKVDTATVFLNGGIDDVYSDSATVKMYDIDVIGGGDIARYCNIIGHNVTAVMDNDYLMQSMQPNTRFYNSKFDASDLFYGGTNIELYNCDLVYTGTKWASGTGIEIQCMDNGVLQDTSYVRYNTDTSALEYYDIVTSAWVAIV